MREQPVDISVRTDTRGFEDALGTLTQLTESFGQTFVSTMRRSIQSGDGFKDTLRSLGQRLSDLALNQALKPLDNLFTNLVSGGVSGLFGGGGQTALPNPMTTGLFASGGVFAPGGLVPFARGGVVSSPTPFAFGQRLGVMGEAGPEAVMPLTRGADGRLGVAMQGAGSGSRGPGIVFNISTPDARSFERSEGQITTLLARAVARGQRGL